MSQMPPLANAWRALAWKTMQKTGAYCRTARIMCNMLPRAVTAEGRKLMHCSRRLFSCTSSTAVVAINSLRLKLQPVMVFDKSVYIYINAHSYTAA
jgi:hypothetical protein